ncbi:MAG: ribose-5-phosphate isomerase RpiA [Verrucomicrobiota bacterium]|nr:ribose-5-phosphate isomerase RpiA [Verrucomicrobiota bacterium]
MGIEEAKRAAGQKAAEFIQQGMIVGLGTGSTAVHFIDALIERHKTGLHIQTVASSRSSAEQASKGGLRVLDLNEAPRVDITVDGADEIDSQKRMIKGGGGAHTREKILAAASTEMIVIVDESKIVSRLGKRNLPVEILFYGSPSTRRKIEALGYKGKWRLNSDGSLFITENGNALFDIEFVSLLTEPEYDHKQLIQIPGVVDTGFFFGLAGRIVVGFSDGRTEIR